MRSWLPPLAALPGLLAASSGWAQDCESVPVTRHPPCSARDVGFNAAANTITLHGEVSCALTDVAAAVPATALAPVAASAGAWLLRAKLVLKEGARLTVAGPAAGGSVAELRLRSVAGPEGPASINAHWGQIELRSTRLTSWDETVGAPMQEPSAFGRAFLRAQSFLDADGSTPRQSRMDVIDTEVAYLGYDAAGSYGLVWKVEGTGPSGSDSPLFNQVEVSGSVVGSHVHHGFMGAYTWGASCMEFIDNDIHDNVVYGLDPHDHSDRLLIANNRSHHNGRHGIICSRNCDSLAVLGNVVHDNALHGIMLHSLNTNTLVQGNIVFNNVLGIALFESHGNQLRDNLVMGNETGIQFYVGSRDNLVDTNQVSGNRRYGILFTTTLDDVPIGGDPHPRDNVVTGNVLAGNGDPGTAAGDAALQRWENNDVTGVALQRPGVRQSVHPATRDVGAP